MRNDRGFFDSNSYWYVLGALALTIAILMTVQSLGPPIE